MLWWMNTQEFGGVPFKTPSDETMHSTAKLTSISVAISGTVLLQMQCGLMNHNWGISSGQQIFVTCA